MPKNEVTLQSEKRSHPVDENLRPIKVGGKATAIETAQQGVGARINGDLTVTGNVNKINAENFVLDAENDITLSAAGGDVTIDDGTIPIFTFNAADSILKIIDDTDNPDDYFQIDVGNSAVTTISTVQDSGSAVGQLILSPDGTLTLSTGAASGGIELQSSGVDRGKFYFGTADECRLSAVSNDLLRLRATGTGGVTIDTTGTGDVALDSNGDIIIDSNDGNFIMRKGATEFSAANSAYAGMILGYTRIANNGTSSSNNVLTINSSAMTVIQTDQGTDFSIQFIVPPSGNVEIQCSFWMNAASRGVKFSLSTDPSYAELGITHTYDADQTVYVDETDHDITNISFAVTGLVAGTDTTYYLAGLASGSSAWINHGRFRLSGSHYPPIILKAIALPATIVTGE